MNRKKIWEAQGKYRSINTGKPMLLVLDKETGATVLEPLYTPRPKWCFYCDNKKDKHPSDIALPDGKGRCAYHILFKFPEITKTNRN